MESLAKKEFEDKYERSRPLKSAHVFRSTMYQDPPTSDHPSIHSEVLLEVDVHASYPEESLVVHAESNELAAYLKDVLRQIDPTPKQEILQSQKRIEARLDGLEALLEQGKDEDA